MKHILSLVVSLAWSVTLFAAITITPASRTFDKDGKGGAILTAGDGTWTASTTADWITITPNTSGNAGESVVYIVNANLSADTRVGTIIVSGNTHTITQTGYDATIDPASATFDLNGGDGTVNVTTLSGISWTAKSNVDWITLESTVGLGNGSVSYTVTKNDSVVTRTGTITLAGNTFSVTQTGVDVTLSPTSTKLESTAQVVLLTITALNTTSWTVTPKVSWISVVSGGSGSGGGSATLAVAANPSWVERTGTVSVGTATLTVKQKGTTNLSFAITPETATAISDGAYGNVAVVATPDAPWTAKSETSWITLSSGQTGAGNGNIQYVVSPNTTLSERTGTIKITPPIAEPEIDLYSGLLFWIKDQTNIEGNELRKTSLPLSTVLDGSKAITFSGEGIPTNSTSSFSFAVSFKIGELNRINRLFELGIGVRSFYVDAQNRLHYDYAGNMLYERTIDWEVTKADQWYTILVSQKLGQDGIGNLNVYLGEKGDVLTRRSSCREGVFVNCKTKLSLGDFVKLGQTRLPSSGYLGGGQFANVRFWNRALTEAECEAVDTMQTAEKQGDAAPEGAPDGVAWDYFPMDGNAFYTRSSSAVPTTAKASMSGWVNAETRFEKKYGAAYSAGSGKLTITNFENMFAGSYVLNDGYDLNSGHCGTTYWPGHGAVTLYPTDAKTKAGSEEDATYSFWMKVGSNSSKSLIFRRTVTCANPSAELDGDLDVQLAISSYKFMISGSKMSDSTMENILEQNRWYHIALVGKAKKSLTLYLDGNEIGSVATSTTLGYLPPVDKRSREWWSGHNEYSDIYGTVDASNAKFEFGGWDGTSDGLAFFHAALSAQQVKALYEAQKMKYYYHTVTQSAATPSFDKTTVRVPANGGNASVTMTLTAGVNWTAKANSYSWVTITSATNGTGSATIDFTAKANTSVYERNGSIQVAGKQIGIVQAGLGAAVTYDEEVVYGTDGGSGNVSVTAEANGSWTATSDVDWITVALGASGNGNGTVTYVVSPYNITTASRTGTLTVAGKKVYITQRGYEMSIDPYVAQIGSNSGASLITVTAPVGAIWEAIAKESWITITGGQSGSGSGTITYSVKENTTGAVRTGTILIAGEIYRITQTYSLAVNVTTNGHGTVAGGGMYDCGTKVTLTATPDEGYYFVGWTGDVVGSDNPCTVTVDTAKNITAIFASVKPIVISNITYENLRGTTHTNPATYQEEMVVAFTPPSGTVTGYSFAGWTPNGITAEMTGDQTVTANWTANSYEVQFHANGGSGTMANLAMTYDAEQSLPSNAFVRAGYVFVGWSAREGTSSTDWADGAVVSNLTADVGGVTELWAVWAECVVATPTITPADGSSFGTATCTVTLACETEGATIYYRTGGGKPKDSPSYLYNGPFEISDTTIIKAFATKDGWTKSSMFEATLTKIDMSLEAALDLGDGVTATTGGSESWVTVVDDTAKSGGKSARSGAIGDSEESWIELSVSGAGTLTFWTKVSCEADDPGYFGFDHLLVEVDDVENLQFRMDGESDWIQRSVAFTTAGTHKVKVSYAKDDSDYEGEDCAWLDGVVWTPSAAPADPIPDLGENPTTEAITNVFVEAKAEDAKLAEKITTEAAYTNFSAWAKKVQPHGGGDAVGAAGVMAAPNVWVSYALGSETLLETAPTDADLTVEAFEPKSGEDGKFDFTVSVEGVEVGGAATTEAQKEQLKENLKQVFELEGGTSLDEGEMSSANVDITFGTPQDGKVKFTAGPKDTGAKTFFMKVKITP